MAAISFVVCCSFVSHVPIQVNGKQGGSFTPKHHVAHNAGAHTMQTPVPARTILTNNKMGAEPPSLYDGTSSVTQNNASRTAVPIRRNVNVHSNCTAQCAQVFQHLFLVREHRPPRSHAQSRTFQTVQNVHCAHNGHSTGRMRLTRRNAANQHVSNQDALHASARNWCTRHNMSHSTPRSFSTVPTPCTQTIANEQ